MRTTALRDGGQAAGIDEKLHRLCRAQVGLDMWCPEEDCREKGKIDPVRCYLFELYLAHDKTPILTFYIYHYLCDLGVEGKCPWANFLGNREVMLLLDYTKYWSF